MIISNIGIDYTALLSLILLLIVGVFLTESGCIGGLIDCAAATKILMKNIIKNYGYNYIMKKQKQHTD